MLLLLPFLQFAVVYGVAFVAAASYCCSGAFAAVRKNQPTLAIVDQMFVLFLLLFVLLLLFFLLLFVLLLILCPFLTFQNVFAAYSVVCVVAVSECVAVSLNLVLLVQLVVCAFPCFFFFFCVFCCTVFAFSVVCPAFAAAFGVVVH